MYINLFNILWIYEFYELYSFLICYFSLVLPFNNKLRVFASLEGGMVTVDWTNTKMDSSASFTSRIYIQQFYNP